VGKPAEEAVIISKEQYKNRTFFAFDLLKNIVFSCKIPASFTASERFKRQLTGYLFCLLLLAAGGLWLFTAITQAGMVRAKLQEPTKYYNTLADRLADRSI
jgi:hypothetical protein